MNEPRVIIGEIRVDGVEPGKPFIRVLDDREAAARVAQFGRCEHPSFTIDLRARRLECGTCGEPVDPLVVLTRWADYDAHLQTQTRLRDDAARRTYRGLCTQLAGKRHVTDAERAELLGTHAKWNAPAEELEALYHRIDGARRERRRVGSGVSASGTET